MQSVFIVFHTFSAWRRVLLKQLRPSKNRKAPSYHLPTYQQLRASLFQLNQKCNSLMSPLFFRSSQKNVFQIFKRSKKYFKKKTSKNTFPPAPWHWGSESDNLGVQQKIQTRRQCHLPKKNVQKNTWNPKTTKFLVDGDGETTNF